MSGDTSAVVREGETCYELSRKAEDVPQNFLKSLDKHQRRGIGVTNLLALPSPSILGLALSVMGLLQNPSVLVAHLDMPRYIFKCFRGKDSLSPISMLSLQAPIC